MTGHFDMRDSLLKRGFGLFRFFGGFSLLQRMLDNAQGKVGIPHGNLQAMQASSQAAAG
jgi:hypothetical protein